MTKLSKRKIKQAIDQVVNHKKSTKSVAALYKVIQRRIQQLVKIYKETGKYPELKMKRRPKVHLTNEEKRIIDEAYGESHLGVRLLRHHIRYEKAKKEEEVQIRKEAQSIFAPC